jgi:non-specific serine/threonine protein kinase
VLVLKVATKATPLDGLAQVSSRRDASTERPCRYRFGTAEFDESAFELRVGGLVIDMQPLPLRVLSCLLRHRGKLVSKDHLLAEVWLLQSISDASITNAVTKLRTGLGENGLFVRTVPGEGYRFAGAVDVAPAILSAEARLKLSIGIAAPGRETFVLKRRLSSDHHNEVWLAESPQTGENRVIKYAPEQDLLPSLRREVKISALLRAALGDRRDIVRISGWNFDRPPFFAEGEWGGDDMIAWAEACGRLDTMTIEERIGIFLQIVDAVAAAHSVGVVHQDIKPSNILMRQEGEGWQVRLTDFGSGRLLDPGFASRFNLTPRYLMEDSPSSVTTAMYMAPELLDGRSATVQSDIFSLGVILYQLLLGRLRAPMPPSWAGDIADAMLRDDIAAATHKDLSRRLDSAGELSRRLRALAARRIEAERQAAEQHERERRNAERERERARRPWIVASFAALCGCVLLLTLYVRHLQRSARVLAEEVKTERALTDFLTDNFIAAADFETVGKANLTVADAARAAASQIDRIFAAGRPGLRAALHAAMANTFIHLSDNDRAVAESGAALKAALAAPETDWRLIASIQLSAAEALINLGRIGDAQARVEQAGRALARLTSPPAELEALLWDAKAGLAAAALDLPAYLREEMEAARLSAPPADVPDRLRTKIQLHVADAERMSGRLADAEAIVRQALHKQRADFGYDDARPSFTEVLLASILGFQGQAGEGLDLVRHAVPCLERALGSNAQRTITGRDIMASLYYTQHQYALAARIWSDVAVSLAASGRPSETRHIGAQMGAAKAFFMAGETAEAERLFRVVLAEQRGSVPPDAPQAQVVRFDLAVLLLEKGRPADVPELRRGLSAEALNMSEQETDWQARLDFLDAFIAQSEGRIAESARLLAKARVGLEAAGDELMTPQLIATLARSLAGARAGH